MVYLLNRNFGCVQPYGFGVVLGIPLPPNLCGGKLVLRVLLTNSSSGQQFDGVLWMFCIIGPNPPTAMTRRTAREHTLVSLASTTSTRLSAEEIFISKRISSRSGQSAFAPHFSRLAPSGAENFNSKIQSGSSNGAARFRSSIGWKICISDM